MKPPSFLYVRPRSLDEALELLKQHGDAAKLLAGGQSLVPLLNLRFAEPRVLVDLNAVGELAFVRVEADVIAIGAMTRHRAIELSREARDANPLLPRIAAEIGHLAIRNRGTIGGSLAHADPAAEWPLAAVALDARITLRSSAAARSMSARDFFRGPLTTAAHPEEIVTAVRFPAQRSPEGYGFAELSRRPGDFAVVAVACRVSFHPDGVCRAATIGVAGAHDTPLYLAAASKILIGSRGELDALEEAGRAASRAVEPAGDVHGSADYRRKMVAVLTRRALGQAFGVAA